MESMGTLQRRFEEITAFIDTDSRLDRGYVLFSASVRQRESHYCVSVCAHTSVGILSLIGLRIAMTATNSEQNSLLENITDIGQIIVNITSFLTNLSSTFIIGLKAW